MKLRIRQFYLCLKCYIESFYFDIILEQNKIVEYIHNTFTVSWEKPKIVSFTSSIMKNVNLLLLPLRFPVKLISCIAFGSASSALLFT